MNLKRILLILVKGIDKQCTSFPLRFNSVCALTLSTLVNPISNALRFRFAPTQCAHAHYIKIKKKLIASELASASSLFLCIAYWINMFEYPMRLSSTSWAHSRP